MGTDFDSFTKEKYEWPDGDHVNYDSCTKECITIRFTIIVLLLLRHTTVPYAYAMYYYDKHEREKDDITRNQAFFCR